MAVDAKIQSKLTGTDGTVRFPFGSFGSNFFGSNVEFGQSPTLQRQSARILLPVRATTTKAPSRVQRSLGKERTEIEINGFSRIGRLVFRVALSREYIEVVAINDPFIDAKYMVYMFNYDSTHGVYKGSVKIVDYTTLEIVGHKIIINSKQDLSDIPWSNYEVEYVVESSGVFTTTKKVFTHLKGGAKKVVIVSPSVDAPMFVVGVNSSDPL